MISNIRKVLRLIILRSPKNFFLMCFLLGIELVTIALSVFSLIPLADYILDPSLNNPSKFSRYESKKICIDYLKTHFPKQFKGYLNV